MSGAGEILLSCARRITISMETLIGLIGENR